MRNLIALELKRNRLRPYHITTLICGVTMLGFQYLMAAIPHMDPTEPDAELFSQYPFLMGITCLVCMAIFLILSAVMASRFVVEEYSGKRAILLLSYPISRKKVLCAKLMLVFAYKAKSHKDKGQPAHTEFLRCNSHKEAAQHGGHTHNTFRCSVMLCRESKNSPHQVRKADHHRTGYKQAGQGCKQEQFEDKVALF